MPCSAVSLSLATICAVIAVALLGIGFGTDNWTYIDVDRTRLQLRLADENSASLTDPNFGSNQIYFTRTNGLFRTCFPRDKPQIADIYLSPVETYCRNVNYYIPDESNIVKTFSEDKEAVVHMMRSMIALFIISFFFLFVGFWTGVAGCWRRSSGNITSTAVLMLLTCLFSAGAMGLCHGVEFYETRRLQEDPYFLGWPDMVKETSKISYDWSYMVTWVGVGASLISAFLFFGAARCLAHEKDKENQNKMQYLMPVYPQKQGQQQQGYAYPYAYPAPYYHGQQQQQQQYGHYNY